MSKGAFALWLANKVLNIYIVCVYTYTQIQTHRYTDIDNRQTDIYAHRQICTDIDTHTPSPYTIWDTLSVRNYLLLI